MGRSPQSKKSVAGLPLLFPAAALPEFEVPPEKDFRSLRHPLWTENKARLIQEYIRLFTFVTKHGAYIDGFAAPQRRERMDLCSAKLVLQTEPKWVRNLWLCDIDPKGIDLLNEIKALHDEPKRRINVCPGDFNQSVENILASGLITDKTATFALLDQRTFECDWSTVQRLARHKTTTKIELFYFFATGWIDRSIAAVRAPETAQRVERWWGRPDWRDLQGMQGVERAKMVAQRFKDEVGYIYAYPYAIHRSDKDNRTMYHMVHATDHPDAPPLMHRAYRKISGRPEYVDAPQMTMTDIWEEDMAE